MSSTGNEPQRVTLEDLAALNHEVSALVRSGWPLEAGLRQVADEFSAGSGKLAARLEEETAAGKTLSEAIAAQGESLPAVYRAVVEAGLKSGRLAAALEGYAETAARMAALRRIAGQAAVYPLIVIIVAWVMFVVVATSVMPGYEVMQLHDPPWLSRLRISAGAAWTLALVGPVVLIALASMWWHTSGTAAESTSWRRWFQWAPGARRTTQLSAQANFADLLRLLLVCRVPMTEALPLAASASGGAWLDAPTVKIAARLASGQPLKDQAETLRQLPPLVRTALLSDASEDQLITGLKRAAEIYRDRASGWIIDMAVILPVAIMLGLAVGVVGVYALLILHPYFSTLNELAHWSWH